MSHDSLGFRRTAHLKVDVRQAAPATEGPVDLQHGLPVLILHNELGGERVPLLDHVAHGVARRGLHLQLRAHGANTSQKKND